MRYLLFTVAAVLLSSSTARAIVVSDFVGSHLTTPGLPTFGVNIDGVVHLDFNDSLRGSGALISDRHVLTAAHMVDWDEDGVVDPLLTDEARVVFELPSGSESLHIESAVVPAEWSGITLLDPIHDIAVITLAADAPAAAPRYPLYGSQGEIGWPIVVMGYGATGHGSVGMDVRANGLTAGLNRYEVDSEEYFFGLMPPNLLIYDFDSGREENNALEWLEIPSDLGFGDDEVGSGLGDSGGPIFLGGAIAGVTSGGFGGLPTDTTAETDSSWGEIFFDTRVSYYQEFLTTATGGLAVFAVTDPGPDCDSDGDVDVDDVDALVGNIVAGTNDLAFDLTADGAVSKADLNQWLSDAATENGFTVPYLLGDSNLDGSVNAADLNNLALNWRQEVASWTEGDFTADGVVDSGDLNELALNWRGSILPAASSNAAVPEPSGLLLTALGLALTWQSRRHSWTTWSRDGM